MTHDCKGAGLWYIIPNKISHKDLTIVYIRLVLNFSPGAWRFLLFQVGRGTQHQNSGHKNIPGYFRTLQQQEVLTTVPTISVEQTGRSGQPPKLPMDSQPLVFIICPK